VIARAGRLISRWYSIPLLLIAWQLVAAGGFVESKLLPAPTRIWMVLVTEIGNGALIYHASVTFSRALSGFALATLAGIPFAIAMARSALWRDLFEPIFFLGYPVPKIALFPVFTYVFGFGSASMIVFTLLECLYPISWPRRFSPAKIAFALKSFAPKTRAGHSESSAGGSAAPDKG
jgi:NitT/TauT family transport system permease protein